MTTGAPTPTTPPAARSRLRTFLPLASPCGWCWRSGCDRGRGAASGFTVLLLLVAAFARLRGHQRPGAVPSAPQRDAATAAERAAPTVATGKGDANGLMMLAACSDDPRPALRRRRPPPPDPRSRRPSAAMRADHRAQDPAAPPGRWATPSAGADAPPDGKVVQGEVIRDDTGRQQDPGPRPPLHTAEWRPGPHSPRGPHPPAPNPGRPRNAQPQTRTRQVRRRAACVRVCHPTGGVTRTCAVPWKCTAMFIAPAQNRQTLLRTSSSSSRVRRSISMSQCVTRGLAFFPQGRRRPPGCWAPADLALPLGGISPRPRRASQSDVPSRMLLHGWRGGQVDAAVRLVGLSPRGAYRKSSSLMIVPPGLSPTDRCPVVVIRSTSVGGKDSVPGHGRRRSRPCCTTCAACHI